MARQVERITSGSGFSRREDSGKQRETVKRKGFSLGKSRTAMDFLDEFSMFVRMFSYLVKDGYTPLSAVTVLSNNVKGDFKHALDVTLAKLSSGYGMSEAFKASGFFPFEFCSILSVGEKSGYLHEALDLYGEYLEKAMSLKNHFMSALRYPSFLLGFICIAIVAILFIIIPKIQTMVTSMGVSPENLPFVSKLMFKAYDLMMILGKPGVAVLMTFLTYYFFFGKGRLHIMKMFSLIPQVRAIDNQLRWAQWLMMGSICMKSGLKLDDSLSILGRISLPKELGSSETYERLVFNVASGQTLSKELGKTKAPSLISSMIGIAEKSGRMSEVMQSIAGQYLYKLSFEVKSIGTVVEPVVVGIVTLLGGSIVGVIMYTIMSVSSSL